MESAAGQGVSATSIGCRQAIGPERQLIELALALLPVAAAGVILCGGDGAVEVSASSNAQARSLGLVQVGSNAGPGLDAYRTGRALAVEDLGRAVVRWPAFVRRAADCGYHSVFALPLRLSGERVGALTLFRTEPGTLSRSEIAVGQALADVATLGILQRRTLNRSELLNRQLQTALDTRIIIEQAKGILAERGSVDVASAFELLRSHARSTRQRLGDLALAVVQGADTDAILGTAGPKIRQAQSA